MIAKIQEWLEEVLESRWFQWLLVVSVIYAASWLYVLPRSGVFNAAAYLAVALWAGVVTVVFGATVLAISRGIKLHFLPWDGREERRWREPRIR